MREIHLTGGFVVIIDDEDFELVSQHNWHVQRRTKTPYAVTNMPRPDGGHSTVGMHVLINRTPKGMVTDHKDGNGLNNTRANLRTATRNQNGQNRAKHQRCTSEFKGVHWDKQKRRWRASIRVNGRLCLIGKFRDEREAAGAYDAAAIEHFGEFARTNKGAAL